MDRLTKQRRSWNMSRIKGKNTKPELQIRKLLYSKGIRYRVHALLPGKPDLVFTRKKICVFINGCFWHMHKGCKNFVVPKTNTLFWMNKIKLNVSRDKRNYALLKKSGWKILVIWECKIESNPISTAQHILSNLY